VDRAIAALEEVMAKRVRPFLAEANGTGAPHAPSLRFPGLGAFGSKVLFIKPCDAHPGTAQLREVSRSVFLVGCLTDACPALDSSWYA
jgi:hypothetical protein